MSKEYDFKKAKKLIEEKKNEIESASLGMAGDWSWTAETVWTKEEGFVIDLDTVKTIAGISGSSWATPTLQMEYKNENILSVHCFTGESTSTKPIWV